MKAAHTILLSFLILLIIGAANAQVTDNFSDGDFSNNPVWNGDDAEFIVNSSQELQMNNTISGKSYLSVACAFPSLNNMQWSFYIKQSFSPSSSNYGRVYLVSDQANLEGALNGYYLQFGETGSSDAIELFRQSGLSSTSICRGINGKISASFSVGVKVTRDTSANWNIYTDYTGGKDYALETTGTDTTYLTANYAGIKTVYSTSNSSKFYFDDFYYGPIQIDSIAPVVFSTIVISSTKLDILFDEPIELASSQTITNYFSDNGIGNPFIALRDTNNLSLVHLIFSNPFKDEVLNLLTIINIQDLNGNAITSAKTTFLYNEIKPFDIVINEILFNPLSGGFDFVEIYNRSNTVIDLKTIRLSQYDTIANKIIAAENISLSGYLMFPQDYLVLSENGAFIKKQYVTTNPSGFLDMDNLPAMNIDKGTVCLSTLTEIIDIFKYDEHMHFGLLNDTKGISLERIDFNSPTQDRNNWHSAGSAVGYATPAYKNSQYHNSEFSDNTIEIIPEIFSPDEDGMNDVVNIQYNLEKPGYVGNVQIYDSNGRLIKQLIKNELLGSMGTFSWDGLTETREKARIGIYIFYVEVFDLTGNVKQYKKTCVLAGKL